MKVINQNVNITSNNQSGGITAQTVNILGKPQRVIDEVFKKNLKINIPPNSQVDIHAPMNDDEAIVFAEEIKNWMEHNGFAGNIKRFNSMFTQREVGIKLDELNEQGNYFRMIVGHQK